MRDKQDSSGIPGDFFYPVDMIDLINFKLQSIMRRNIILIGIILFSLDSFGQIAKDKVIISMNGNFMKINTESGVKTNEFSTKGQYVNLGTSIGVFLSDHFIMGVSVNYNWGKETRMNKLIYGNNLLQIEQLEIRSNILLPGVFFGYYVPIVGKFYFNTNMVLNCGKVNSDYERLFAQRTTYFSTDSSYIYIDNNHVSGGSSGSSSTYYFSAQICPELSYFISSKFGLSMGLGGIEYSLTDWKSENSAFAVNFNPAYWKLGVKFIL
jgi:hypothetical protein